MRKADIENKLEALGIKSTPIRVSLLHILYSAKRPKSADNLHSDLKTLSISSHRATMYRDLNLFQKHNLIKKITLLGEHAELYVVSKEHVHHFKCMECNNIQPFNTESIDDAIEGFVSKISSEGNWLVRDYRFKIYGICDKCKKNKESEHED